jgi:hypothetical protein
MTTATREALEKVSEILHEAGWDAPSTNRDQSITPERLAHIRHVYETLLRHDHVAILEATLGRGLDIGRAGAGMGLPAEDANLLLAEALQRLTDFVETCDEEFSSPLTNAVRKPTGAK